MNTIDYFLFDLDGTLTDSKIGILNSYIYALKKMCIQDLDTETLESYIGHPLKNTFMERYNLSEYDANESVSFYREYFSEFGLFENKLYPGVFKTLNDLKNLNKKLFVVTSKPKFFADKIINHFNLIQFFKDIIGSNLDNSMTNKSDLIKFTTNIHKLEIQKCLMIGDRKHDIIGAKNVGVSSCAVTYGYGSLNELKDENPDFVVDNLSDILNFI